ncbi:MAG: glycosyltransferase family 2 protein [Puniceicoccales bacterium]|jgi:glycosyltransferase involved in cell wall biosynthesis|nr:glycosyltransferase family 2 protein [Puniceicoccales bacterium]
MKRLLEQLLAFFCLTLCCAFGSEVSICIPVYNVERWLPRALDSAINQTLKDIEIICVDDCSTDGSLAILKSYAAKDPRIKVFKNEKNMGTLYTRFRATIASTGDRILFLDPDDELSNSIAEKSLAVAKKTGADIVFFRAEEVFAKNRRQPALWLYDGPKDSALRPIAEIFSMIRDRKATWNMWGRLWIGDHGRAVAAQWLEFASRNHICMAEDALFFHFLVKKAATYAAIPDVGYSYYRDTGGITTQKSAADAAKNCCNINIVFKVIADDDFHRNDYILKRMRFNIFCR